MAKNIAVFVVSLCQQKSMAVLKQSSLFRYDWYGFKKEGTFNKIVSHSFLSSKRPLFSIHTAMLSIMASSKPRLYPLFIKGVKESFLCHCPKFVEYVGKDRTKQKNKHWNIKHD